MFISAEELQGISAANAMEAVIQLRAEWLSHRGEDAITPPQTDNIRVYVGEMPVGRVAALAGIDSGIIESIRFIRPNLAIIRWGADHYHGVIQIIRRN